jgi:hypothetical protein
MSIILRCLLSILLLFLYGIEAAESNHSAGIARATLLPGRVAANPQASQVKIDRHGHATLLPGSVEAEPQAAHIEPMLSQLDSQSPAAPDLGMIDEACKQPKPTDPEKWNAMKAMAIALNSLDAPYNIHAGTVLGLVRSCSIFDYDIDFAVERDWLKSNLDQTVSAILAGGFTSDRTLGQPDHVGYERKFRFVSPIEADARRLYQANVKAAFKTNLATNGNGSKVQVLHSSGINVDLFTIERTSDHYEYGLWMDNGERASCYTKSTGTAEVSWLGVNVKVPVPLADVLTSLYGEDYMTPRPWTWNVEPFTIGSCHHTSQGTHSYFQFFQLLLLISFLCCLSVMWFRVRDARPTCG